MTSQKQLRPESSGMTFQILKEKKLLGKNSICSKIILQSAGKIKTLSDDQRQKIYCSQTSIIRNSKNKLFSFEKK